VPLPCERIPSRIKLQRIKLVLGSRCELCGRENPADLLEVHAISGDRLRKRGMVNLEREILVLCGSCHRDVHEAGLTPAEQKEILRYRQRDARKKIRQILDYTPRPYVPPELNIPEIFEEAIRINTYIFGV
jgi:hypothetical protein